MHSTRAVGLSTFGADSFDEGQVMIEGERSTVSRRGGGGGGPAPHLAWLHPGGMADLSFMNAILKIVTLGVYQFWGKTEVRKRIWSAVRIDGEPLEYTGTGMEMFKGFLFVFAIVLIPALLIPLVLVFAAGPNSPALVIYQLVAYVVFLYLFGVAVYRAQRYRLTRTRWRGIRGDRKSVV